MEKVTLYYIFDPYCGWCYGFSPVIKKFYEVYKNDFNFTVLSGGMIMGENEGPISTMQDFISQASKQVEEASGVTFGAPFLEALKQGKILLSSPRPSLALTTYKTLGGADPVLFAHDIQKAFYDEGKDLQKIETYSPILSLHNIDPESFKIYFNSEMTMKLLAQEIDVVQSWGIQGFPTMLAIHKDKALVLTKGFVPYETLEDIIINKLPETLKEE
jgi:putative protein-disulfide isomerase